MHRIQIHQFMHLSVVHMEIEMDAIAIGILVDLREIDLRLL